MIRRMQAVAGTVLIIMGCAWGQTNRSSSRTTVSALGMAPAAATVSTFTATPATVTITANNPGGTVPSTSSTVSAGTSKATTGTHPTWNMQVAASANSMTGTGCPNVPISAITVSCSTATAGGRGSSATCAGNFTLSTTYQTFVSGLQGDTGNPTYSATLVFNLADGYQFYATQGQACTLTLQYQATFN